MLTHYISLDFTCDHVPHKLNIKVSDGVEMYDGYTIRPARNGYYALEMEQERAFDSTIAEAAERLANYITEEENLSGEAHRHLAGWVRDCIDLTVARYDKWREQEKADIHRIHDEIRASYN